MSGRAFSLVESDQGKPINTIIISPIFRMQSESSKRAAKRIPVTSQYSYAASISFIGSFSNGRHMSSCLF